MTQLNYGFVKKIEGATFQDALGRVTDALKEEGFGILTEIDVKSTLKEKLDLDFRRYTILGACNPPLAHQALEAESHIGLLLPCNVVVQELPEAGVEVSIAAPKAMFTLVENTRVAPVAAEAEQRLRRVMAAL